MEFSMSGIESTATKWDVTRAIARVLHSPEFQNNCQPSDVKLHNFRVDLEMQKNMGVRNTGHGALTVGSVSLGDRIMNYLNKHSIRPDGSKKKITFAEGEVTYKPEALLLKKLPFISPDREEDRERILRDIDRHIMFDSVSIGHIDREHATKRIFKCDWEPSQSKFSLDVDFDHKIARIVMGDPTQDNTRHDIAIKFDNLKTIVTGTDFMRNYAVLELQYPPSYEWSNMFLSGMKEIHSKGADFGDSHARVAPYVYHIRVTFVDDDSFNGFLTFCKACNLPRPIKVHVPTENSNDYSHPNFAALRKWFLTLDFRIAFQCEALIANSRVTPSQLLDLKPAIQRVILQYKSQPATCAHVLRYFNDRVPNRKPGTPLTYFFEECSQKEEATRNTEAKGGLIHVHQVTFTPSAMRLEGPHLSNSNRVLRIYAEHQDNFVRVDFRDEEKMQFRWTTDIDGSTFVESHVGDILRNGFTLCGRKFEILGYSVSALREHAIWFLHPFTDPSGLLIDAKTIRDGLGDFHYKNVIACPATYGARMAQAFTATDATVTLEEHEWEMISDIERGRWNHTDGVGTMSPALQHRIWAELCKLWGLRDVTHNVPCVFQVRIGGCKGVIVLNPFDEGVKLCLRDSMKKYDIPESKQVTIEVARAFVGPTKMYLNRPLIQLMECLGVPAFRFQELQQKVVEQLEGARTSIQEFIEVLRLHDLGRSFGLAPMLGDLVTMLADNANESIKNPASFGPFIQSLISYAIVHAHRALKYQARIPVPRSWNLVGVADEGYRYWKAGMKNMRTLREREIFAAIRDEDGQVEYLKGPVWVSRPPQVHPGDIQMVWAVGKPELEEGEICFFDKIFNSVVFGCRGHRRPLPNYLGGGDLDGDTYMICQLPTLLLPTAGKTPADYEGRGKKVNEDGRASTMEDVVDFILEYINYDMCAMNLGLLSHQHSVIADQSEEGVFDERCKKLAELCSQAVDFPKTGNRPLREEAPRRYMRPKPDWSQYESKSDDLTYYRSDKALGILYRAIEIEEPSSFADVQLPPGLEVGAAYITKRLRPFVAKHLPSGVGKGKVQASLVRRFKEYVAELTHIAHAHCLSDDGMSRLDEQELVLGTIMAPSTQPRHRRERVSRVKLHMRNLVKLTEMHLGEVKADATKEDIRKGIRVAWEAWQFSVTQADTFGGPSFGLISLGCVLRLLKKLSAEEESLGAMQPDSFYKGVVELGAGELWDGE